MMATYNVNQVGLKQASSDPVLSEIQSVIRDDLEQVQAYILEALDSKIPLIQEIGKHIIGYGGKKLRPITVFLSARAFGYEGPHHITLATILEFIHVATLLHDDVVDESSLRRGRASANSIWGNPASVLVGDFFYSRSFEMLVIVNQLPIFDVMASATRRISEGEIMQLEQLQTADTTEKQYFETIERKTASLFWAAAKMGAIIANQSDEVQQQMAEYGSNLGLSFQLIDDYLDYAGDTTTIGKKVGDDLTEGKLTLPLIYARDNVSAAKRKIIETAVRHPNEANIEEICEIVASSGALEYTVGLAREYSRRATEEIDFLPHSLFQVSLINLAEFACNRNY